MSPHTVFIKPDQNLAFVITLFFRFSRGIDLAGVVVPKPLRRNAGLAPCHARLVQASDQGGDTCPEFGGGDVNNYRGNGIAPAEFPLIPAQDQGMAQLFCILHKNGENSAWQKAQIMINFVGLIGHY